MLLGLNGLRVSEVCAAQIKDLRREPGGRTLRVRGKGGKEVSVRLNARTELTGTCRACREER